MPKPFETWFVQKIINIGFMLARCETTRPVLTFARLLTNICWIFMQQDKNTMLRNLNIAFKDSITNQEKNRIAYKTLENLAITCAELLRFHYTSPTDLVSMVKEVEGWHYLEEAKAKGKGIIGLGLHFGNWEYIGYYLSLKGFPITDFALPLNDPIADELINKLRKKFGLRIIQSSSSFLRTCVETLKMNEILGLIADQYAGPLGTVVPFMGTPAYTYAGPAVFHLKYKADILPMYSVRLRPFQYKVIIEAPIEYPALTGERETDEKIVLNAVSQRLGNIIQKYPDHWLWTHKRWKSPN